MAFMPVPRITREELKARLDSPDPSSHPVIVDVRLKYPYEHSTVKLPGARHALPEAVATLALPRDKDIVLYDSDPDDMVSGAVAADLQKQGYRALALQGGIAEWMNAKFPVDSKPAPQPAAPAAKAAPAAPAKAAAAPAASPAPPAAASAAAAAPKSAGPAAVEGPATPPTESKP